VAEHPGAAETWGEQLLLLLPPQLSDQSGRLTGGSAEQTIQRLQQTTEIPHRENVVLHEQAQIGNAVNRPRQRMIRKRMHSEPQIAQSREVVGSGAAAPGEQLLGGRDRHVIDARLSTTHQAILRELPVLISMGAEMVA
jgi:hypothetical protein